MTKSHVVVARAKDARSAQRLWEVVHTVLEERWLNENAVTVDNDQPSRSKAGSTLGCEVQGIAKDRWKRVAEVQRHCTRRREHSSPLSWTLTNRAGGKEAHANPAET